MTPSPPASAPIPASPIPTSSRPTSDHGGYKYHVVNRSVSGATSKDGVLRLPEVVALKPQVVIVEFGGNDGLRGLPVPAMQANLDRILAALQKTGAKILLAGIILPPDYGPDYVNSFIATYPTLAAKYKIALYPLFFLRMSTAPPA